MAKPTLYLKFKGGIMAHSGFPVGGAMESLAELYSEVEAIVIHGHDPETAISLLKGMFNAHYNDDWPSEAHAVWRKLRFVDEPRQPDPDTVCCVVDTSYKPWPLPGY